LPARRPPARRHHLVSPGDIISESAGDIIGICIAVLLGVQSGRLRVADARELLSLKRLGLSVAGRFETQRRGQFGLEAARPAKQ
jgi:hypothetical protein